MIAIATKSSTGLMHGSGLLDEKNDPDNESLLGYAEGVERGVDLMERLHQKKYRRWWEE